MYKRVRFILMFRLHSLSLTLDLFRSLTAPARQIVPALCSSYSAVVRRIRSLAPCITRRSVRAYTLKFNY